MRPEPGDLAVERGEDAGFVLGAELVVAGETVAGALQMLGALGGLASARVQSTTRVRSLPSPSSTSVAWPSGQWGMATSPSDEVAY